MGWCCLRPVVSPAPRELLEAVVVVRASRAAVRLTCYGEAEFRVSTRLSREESARELYSYDVLRRRRSRNGDVYQSGVIRLALYLSISLYGFLVCV